MRRNFSSNSPWEPIVGYSRAVLSGDRLYVSGTTATDENGTVVGLGDCYAQARHILDKIDAALGLAGASLADVVRTRIYVTDISRWEDVARAHRERFLDVRPAATMVEVSRLISPDMLVEIEATATLPTTGFDNPEQR